jgi:hypothetical protein
VANRYGLAYIPDDVNLPDHVTMATADETLPPQGRAKWATYPILAIKGWAQAHDQKLRAVIDRRAVRQLRPRHRQGRPTPRRRPRKRTAPTTASVSIEAN